MQRSYPVHTGTGRLTHLMCSDCSDTSVRAAISAAFDDCERTLIDSTIDCHESGAHTTANDLL